MQEVVQKDPYLKARIEANPDVLPEARNKEFNALISTIKDLALQIIQLSPNIPSEAALALRNIESPTFLVNFIASNLNIEVGEKQNLLEINNLHERSTKVLEYLNKELQLLELKNQIQSKVKTDLDKQQREYSLHHQPTQYASECEEHQQHIIS